MSTSLMLARSRCFAAAPPSASSGHAPLRAGPASRTLRSWLCALRAHRLRRDLDGFDDPLVSGAAAQVAREPFLDLVEARARVVLQERVHAHHEPGRAEAALQTVGLAERLLHRAERPVGGTDALDG